jgi:hypothetical protein
MGAEAVWVPYALAAASAAGTVYNTQRTARKQDNALAAQLLGQAEKQREADARVSQLLDQQAASTDADERTGALASFNDIMQAKRANTQLRQRGALSDTQRADAADAALGVSDYGSKIAGLLAAIDAPGQQRQNEAFAQGRFGQDIDRIKRASAGDDFLAQMRLRGITRNPWIDAASQFAAGAASGMAQGQGIAVGEPSPYGPYASGYKYPTGNLVKLPAYLTGGGNA